MSTKRREPAKERGNGQDYIQNQKNPTTLPSSVRTIRSGDGPLSSPGMVMISLQIIATNSASAASRTSRMFKTCPPGAPRTLASPRTNTASWPRKPGNYHTRIPAAL